MTGFSCRRGPALRRWRARRARSRSQTPRLSINFASKDIPDAAHRFDHRRVFGVRLDLFSQPGDLSVDRAVERLPAAPPRELHQSLSAADTPRMSCERSKKIEFASGERDIVAGWREKEPAGDVEGPPFVANDAVTGLTTSDGLVRRFSPPLKALDARQHLAQVKRFGDVIVCADFKTDDAVEHIVPAGQHDNSDIGLRSYLTSQCQSVVARQNDIKQQHVKLQGAELRAHRCAVRSNTNPISLLLEITNQHLADARIVIDDENTCSLFRSVIHRRIEPVR